MKHIGVKKQEKFQIETIEVGRDRQNGLLDAFFKIGYPCQIAIFGVEFVCFRAKNGLH